MAKNVALFVVLLAAASVLPSCSSPSATTDTSTASSPSTAPSPATEASPATGASPATAVSGSLKDPKSSIAYQFDLLKAGDVDTLKTCMTPRVRDRVTQETVDKAKTDSAKYTMDDLFASAEMGQASGKKTAKVKMKGGRTLTTLIETNGKWLADTVWFQ